MTLHLSDATLHDFPYSSSSFRLRIALNLKGLTPRAVERVDLRGGRHLAADFVALAGAPAVPVMDFGHRAFAQSLALIEWLDTAHPTPRLIPADAEDALAVRAIALTVACDIHPLNVPRVLKRLTGPMGLTEAAKQDWYAHWVQEGFAVLERQLAAQGGGPSTFCIGESPTLADICIVPQVHNARRFGVDIDGFGRVLDIYEHCMAEDAFRDAAPAPD